MAAPPDICVPLQGGRELHVARWAQGLVVLSVHGEDGGCRSGPLALRETDLGVLQGAIAALAIADDEPEAA
jgi:hypothetical protein